MALKEAPQAEIAGNSNISYRANETNTFERNPQTDTFDKSGKKKKTSKLAASLAAIAAVILALICFAKGKGPEGTTKKFGERMKDGWKNLWHKNPVSKDAPEEAIEKAKTEAEEAAKKAKEAEEAAKTAKEAEDAAKNVKEAKPATLEDLSKASLKNCKKEQISKYIDLKYADNPEYAKLYDYCANSRQMKKLNMSLNELSEFLDKVFVNMKPEAKDSLLKSDALYKKFKEMNVNEFDELVAVVTKDLDADLAQGLKSRFKLNNGEENVMNFWQIGKRMFSLLPKETDKMFKIRFKPIRRNKNMLDCILDENAAIAKKKV